jgi:hypothetical protein
MEASYEDEHNCVESREKHRHVTPCIRQHTSAYVSTRQHTSAYVSVVRKRAQLRRVARETQARDILRNAAGTQRQYLYFCTSNASKLSTCECALSKRRTHCPERTFHTLILPLWSPVAIISESYIYICVSLFVLLYW